LETSRFGVIEVDPESVITFTQPIIGFQEFRRFLLIAGPPDSQLVWLQSTDSGELAFILMDPRCVIPEYRATLGAHELSELAVQTPDDLEIYTLVVAAKDPTKVRTNLRAPILINRKHRLGKQTVLDKSDYPIQFYLAQAKQGSTTRQEVGHARPDA